jgi:cellulose biosynthesis protein BcsQ
MGKGSSVQAQPVVVAAGSRDRLLRLIDDHAHNAPVAAAFLDTSLARKYADARQLQLVADDAESHDERPATEAPRTSPQIIACYSPSGGAGTSLCAAALALQIANATDLRTLLIDLDLQNGNQAFVFDITEPKRSSLLGLRPLVDQIISRSGRDPAKFGFHAQSILPRDLIMAKTFVKDNVHVLCALDDPAAIDEYTDPAVHIEALLDTVAPHFDVVVLDLPHNVDLFCAPALFRADDIVLVTRDDIPGQIKMARMLNFVLTPLFAARGVSLAARCHLVVNRSGKRKTDVLMPVDVVGGLPEDEKFETALISRRTPWSRLPNTSYRKSVEQLAETLTKKRRPA